MGLISAIINVGTPPYSIVVRKQGEVIGNRCSGSCNSFPITFSHDSGVNAYYFILTDSLGCTYDSRTGGVAASINCDVAGPNYNYELKAPNCDINDNVIPGTVRIYNITNATRYKLCLGTTTFNCTPCTDSTGILTSGIETTINIPVAAVGELQRFVVRIYNGDGCSSYSDISSEYLTPSCGSTEIPDFSAEVIQPSCSTETNGVIQNGSIKLSNVVNATRYKLCYNSNTFNSGCQATCSSSDGVITGSTIQIPYTAPSEGVAQAITLRVYNGASCTVYKDFTFNVYSPKCSGNELTMMNLDMQIFFGESGPKCEQPNTYDVGYDMYVTPNTPGMSENGQQAKTGTAANRVLPAGNDVPNVFIASAFKMLCGSPGTANSAISNAFHRFTWNMSLLKAKYPAINEFIFDVYVNKTKDSWNTSTTNAIRPRINAFTGTAMTKQLYSNNAQDAYRSPLYDGFSCWNQGCPDPLDQFTNTASTMQDITYKQSVSGMRKVATIKYNYSTNKVTWTQVPQ